MLFRPIRASFEPVFIILRSIIPYRLPRNYSFALLLLTFHFFLTSFMSLFCSLAALFSRKRSSWQIIHMHTRHNLQNIITCVYWSPYSNFTRNIIEDEAKIICVKIKLITIADQLVENAKRTYLWIKDQQMHRKYQCVRTLSHSYMFRCIRGAIFREFSMSLLNCCPVSWKRNVTVCVMECHNVQPSSHSPYQNAWSKLQNQTYLYQNHCAAEISVRSGCFLLRYWG
jgi:hypothetical protein